VPIVLHIVLYCIDTFI